MVISMGNWKCTQWGYVQISRTEGKIIVLMQSISKIVHMIMLERRTMLSSSRLIRFLPYLAQVF